MKKVEKMPSKYPFMFNKTFERVIGNEGRYQCDYNDRGNWTTGIVGKGELKGTKFGISAMTYPHLDIKNLTVNQAKAIYYNDWWSKLGMNRFREAIQFQMFDAAINHGMHGATIIFQHAVSVTADGIIGPNTKSAAEAMDINDLLLCFLAERLSYMTDISTWEDYGKGWSRRIAHNLKYAASDN